MTRILTTGYETGDVNEVGVSQAPANTTVSVVNSNPTPRLGGNWCIRFLSQGNNTMCQKNISFPAKTELWMRFAVMLHGGLYSTYVDFVEMYDSGGGAQIGLEYNQNDNLIRVRRGASGTVLVTSIQTFTSDVWHVIEWHVQILTGGTTGQTDLYLDGTFQGTFSGQVANDTNYPNMTSFQFGYVAGYGGNTNTYWAFDDIAINDTNGTINNQRVGDGRVVYLVPNGPGSATALTRGGTDTGANWSQLSEVPPSIAQYVASANIGDRDLYAMSDLPANVTVNCVEAIVMAQNTDAGAGAFGLTIHSGTTINESAPQYLGTSPMYVGARWETDPNTGAAWTLAAVNAVEAGLTVR